MIPSLKAVYVVYILFDVGQLHYGTTEQVGGEWPTFQRCAQYLFNLKAPEPGWLDHPPFELSCRRKVILADRP